MRITGTRAVALPQTRHVRGRMNKTEAAYAENLELRRMAGEVVAWRFEDVGLRLADRTLYYPDFQVILSDGTVEFHEVKGHWMDDARVKWKAVAERFPEFRFLAVKKKGGGWEFEEYGAHRNSAAQ